MKPSLKQVSIVTENDEIIVTPVWNGVDRPASMHYAMPIKHKKLAERLKKAIESGKCWYREPQILIDVHGLTYVNASLNLLMRTANADLKRMGF